MSPPSTSLITELGNHDAFFCQMIDLIPKEVYFPTDEEENWLKSGPHAAKKFHKNTKDDAPKQSIKEQSRKGKRAKFNPDAQKTNVEHQKEVSEVEKIKQMQGEDEDSAEEANEETGLTPQTKQTDASIDGLRVRLQKRIETMKKTRESSKDSKMAKKAQKEKEKEKSKKRKKNAKDNTVAKKKQKKQENTRDGGEKEKTKESNTESSFAISYGSLLLPEDKAKDSSLNKFGTKKGSGKSGIQNLLKKAEENQKKVEELKKTEEGKQIVKKENWKKAIDQASGAVVKDDPKLLRKALKKKEKQKQKSASEWKQRISNQKKAQKDSRKKKVETIRSKRNRNNAGNKRAGFEGKKGDKFLNSDK